jgi:hypothetical protein
VQLENTFYDDGERISRKYSKQKKKFSAGGEHLLGAI